MKTMRERFDETFYEEVNSFMGTAFGDYELDAKLKDFIEQELKKEREEIIALVNGKKVIEPDAYDEPVASDIAVCINSKIDDIINTIKNRT